MRNILSKSETVSFEANTSMGAEELMYYLLHNNQLKIRETNGAINNLKRIKRNSEMTLLEYDLCLQGILLSNIGYSEKLVNTGFHHYDAYEYLRGKGWSEDICLIVLTQSYAEDLSKIMFPRVNNLALSRDLTDATEHVRNIVTISNLHTKPNGHSSNYEGRLMSLLNIHGLDSIEFRHAMKIKRKINILTRFYDPTNQLQR